MLKFVSFFKLIYTKMGISKKYSIIGGGIIMNILKKEEGKSLILELEGRLDTMTSKQLEEEVNTSFENKESVLLNFEKLEYLSSAGLRVILLAQKKMNKQGEMKITNVNETVREVFEITGFMDILTIE